MLFLQHGADQAGHGVAVGKDLSHVRFLQLGTTLVMLMCVMSRGKLISLSTH